ncbi:MAG: hypothetical protein M1816_004446, partial [Peltula sp. TS41687]
RAGGREIPGVRLWCAVHCSKDFETILSLAAVEWQQVRGARCQIPEGPPETDGRY